MTRVEDKAGTQESLENLKDFQRRTVDYAYGRLMDESGSGRFLVADEVGLGKTLVARGVMAKMYADVDRRRFNVLYICSNAQIAQQNWAKLALKRERSGAPAYRSTLLPLYRAELDEPGPHLISFTPGTSLDLSHGDGRSLERALLLLLLFPDVSARNQKLFKLFAGPRTGYQSFKKQVDSLRGVRNILEQLRPKFTRGIARRCPLKVPGPYDDRIRDLARRYCKSPDEFSGARRELMGCLRTRLATINLRSLKPDLIILDEFQRFSHVLTGEAGELTMQLLRRQRVPPKVLLLSATPYRMLSLSQDLAADQAYENFLKTLEFLFNHAEDKMAQIREQVQRFGQTMMGLRTPPQIRTLETEKQALEQVLREVMVRTERRDIEHEQDEMTQDICMPVTLAPEDLKDYGQLQHLSDVVDGGDMLEYWKAAPYLLNFMDNYLMKQKLGKLSRDQRAIFQKFLQRDKIAQWPNQREASDKRNRTISVPPVRPRNARMRALLQDPVISEGYRLLWMPPALPYYPLSGPFATVDRVSFTKRLIFSGWKVVPKAVSVQVSRYADSQIAQARGKSRPTTLVPSGSFLRLDLKTALAVLVLMYPSKTLAKIDPLDVCKALVDNEQNITLEAVLNGIERQLQPLLETVIGRNVHAAQPDDRWYWMAPILLDYERDPVGTQNWWDDKARAKPWGTVDPNAAEGVWAFHVVKVREFISQWGSSFTELGGPPQDLLRVLAEMTLAGPGVAALRTYMHTWLNAPIDAEILEGAARLGWSFRNFLNLPQYASVLHGLYWKDGGLHESPWRKALRYCVEGGLQAVLDEYAAFLKDSRSLDQEEPSRAWFLVVDAMSQAMGLQAGTPQIDWFDAEGTSQKLSVSTRFARRFSDDRSDDNRAVKVKQIQDAFNSPFWPFILVTTSVGQEGLDFHAYCHAVIHWDLPNNPVDLEQRNGRVHRYKGHAIRKNVAAQHGRDAMVAAASPTGEVLWDRMFKMAAEQQSESASELVPYWTYPIPGGAQVESRFFRLPLSRDESRLARLRQLLAIYRMVVGQPNQEDLIDSFWRHFGEEARTLGEKLRVDLKPPIT